MTGRRRSKLEALVSGPPRNIHSPAGGLPQTPRCHRSLSDLGSPHAQSAANRPVTGRSGPSHNHSAVDAYAAAVSYGLRDLDGERVELCDECGFDAREPRDLTASLEVAYDSLRRLVTHKDADRRRAGETWSGAEYAEHYSRSPANRRDG